MKTEKETSVSFTIPQLLRLNDEAFVELVIDRIQALECAHPKDAMVGYLRVTPAYRLHEWFCRLPMEQVAAFFEATTWPPKQAEKPKAKTSDQKRVTRKAAASPTPRAKRSKTKEELAELRKSKRASSATTSAKPRTRRESAPKPARLAKPPVGADEEEDRAKPRRPSIATGEQLAGDTSERDKVLEYIRGRSNVTAKEIETFCVLTPGQTKGILKRLREQGAIRVDGKNRGAKYFANLSNGAAAHV